MFKTNLTELKEETSINTIVVEDFNTPLTPMNRLSRQKKKKKKKTLVFNNTLDQMNLKFTGNSIQMQ